MAQENPVVYIVHAVDVEGPMTETLDATFERMWSFGLPKEFGISSKTLNKVLDKNLEGINQYLANKLYATFNKHLLGYWNNWDQIDKMLSDLNSVNFRNKYSSPDGSPYVFSWFIYDHHEGFTNNPRMHDIGTHKIFNHYMRNFLAENKWKDGTYWHYHHPPVNGDALGANTGWSNNVSHETIIARRIIELGWYFSAFRAGMHIERNDLSHWLEMYIPFDFSARYCPPGETYRPGLFFDWRGCPECWGGWHPDWYDYRRPGNMRRWQFRCTDLWTYCHRLDYGEVRQAFDEARLNGSSVLVYYNHDYRDMRLEIQHGYEVINNVYNDVPDVSYRFVTALEAAQLHLGLTQVKPKLSCIMKGNMLHVTCDTQIFGPQPFLAVQQGDVFFRDNFTQESENSWVYEVQYPRETLALGVAANSTSGLYDVKVINLLPS